MKKYLLFFLSFNLKSEFTILDDEMEKAFEIIENNVLEYKSMYVNKNGAYFYRKKGGYDFIKVDSKQDKDIIYDKKNLLIDFAHKNYIFVNNKSSAENMRLNFFITLKKWSAPLIFTLLITSINAFFFFSPQFDRVLLTYNYMKKKFHIEDFMDQMSSVYITAQLSFFYTSYKEAITMWIEKFAKECDALNLNFKDLKTPFSLYQIGGCEEAKTVLKNIAISLNNIEKCKKYDVKPPKGILLYGPPGTGKTMLAKALAYEMNCSFISLSADDFSNKYGPNVIKHIFKIARLSKRCVLFIDEIENIGISRKSLKSDKEARDTLVSLLTEIDGFNKSNSEIIIIGATNYIDDMDSALLRPGRFDKTIYIDNPDLNARKEILKIHSKNIKFDSDVNLDVISNLTSGFSGALLTQVVNDAKILAMKRTGTVNQRDLLDSRDQIIYGSAKTFQLSKNDAIQLAKHEAAHALVAFDKCDFINNKRVSIVIRDKIGLIETSEHEGWNYKTKDDYINYIMCCLAGKVVEEELYDDKISERVSYDIQKANNLAEEMILKFGIDNLILDKKLDHEIIQQHKIIILNKLYMQVKIYIKENKSRLDKLTSALLEKKSLTDNDLKNILQE